MFINLLIDHKFTNNYFHSKIVEIISVSVSQASIENYSLHPSIHPPISTSTHYCFDDTCIIIVLQLAYPCHILLSVSLCNVVQLLL